MARNEHALLHFAPGFVRVLLLLKMYGDARAALPQPNCRLLDERSFVRGANGRARGWKLTLALGVGLAKSVL